MHCPTKRIRGMDSGRRFLRTLLLVASCWGCCVAPAIGDEPTPEEIFATRIMPIFNSPNPSSCVQCHLASVDLKDYILPSHEETFLALRDQELINTENPDASKILDLIAMGEQDEDLGAQRIHAKLREQEFEAFRHWIVACCEDAELVARESDESQTQAGPSVSHEVVRHSRKDRVLDSFVRNVWSQRMRCFPCHTPGELDPNNPQHENAIAQYEQMKEEFGGRMNLFQETPERTYRSLLASGRSNNRHGLPLVNFEDPQQSLLLLKPMARLPKRNEDGSFEPPSYEGDVSHMGGLKIHKDDHSYKAILAWIEDVAILEAGGYASTDELPADNWLPTQYVIRLSHVPVEWEAGTIVQMFVHSRNAESGVIADEPLGFIQGIVTPRRFVNGPLILFADQAESPDADSTEISLTSGTYALRVYADLKGIIAESPTSLLDSSPPDGELPFETEWTPGFRNATMLNGNDLTAPDVP